MTDSHDELIWLVRYLAENAESNRETWKKVADRMEKLGGVVASADDCRAWEYADEPPHLGDWWAKYDAARSALDAA